MKVYDVGMDKLYLSFPQWQGSGPSNEIYHGCKLLTKNLTTFPFTKIEVPEQDELIVENNILGYKPLKTQLANARNVVQDSQPKRIFTLGGGCDVEIIPISYLNKIYNGKMAVIWIDAHGDLNTPESSPSKNFHGMPLRLLLGDGDNQIKSLTFSQIKQEQVFLFGVRDLDKPEEEYISQFTIPVTTDLNFVISAIKQRGLKNIYLHLDLDVLDTNEFPFVKVPSPKGLSLETVKQLISKLKTEFTIVGGSVVEYSPGTNNEGLETATDLAQLILD